MALQVMFDIFSGRPNPAIVLDGGDAAELLKRLQSAAKLGPEDVISPFESSLGYRGLVIEQTGPSPNAALPTRFRVVDGKLFAPNMAYRIADASIEDFVLGAANSAKSGALPSDLAALIREEAALRRTTKFAQPSAAALTGAPVKCPCAPLYEPGWWNDGGQKQLHNNCYNYACDYRTDTFAQPGRAGGTHMTALSCPGVKPAALSDALLDYPQRVITCPGEGCLVALVIWPRWDFHWYRMGRDGSWSHKPGNTPVTNVDNSGLPISDPRTANRGRYADFCSLMIAMHGHIKIS